MQNMIYQLTDKAIRDVRIKPKLVNYYYYPIRIFMIMFDIYDTHVWNNSISVYPTLSSNLRYSIHCFRIWVQAEQRTENTLSLLMMSQWDEISSRPLEWNEILF